MSDERSVEAVDRKRHAEILAVFAAHNFYANGFTPWEMRTTLEDLGPTYVKIGQILSSHNDMLPEAYCVELAKLRSEVAPLPASVVRETIESEVGKPIDEVFAEFDDEPLGSASIAQVHRGVLTDGTRVVTKVQRPLIADMMRRDFVLLRKIADFVGVLKEEEGSGMIDLASAIAELEEVTEEELDFRVEARHTREFRESCIEDPSVMSCPKIIDELSTERVLTMTFVEGYSIAHRDRIDADGYDREAICDVILSNYMHQVLDVGMFHADPHQGNIMLSRGVPYWIDFGMVGRVSKRSIGVVQSIMIALVGQDDEALADAALSLGKSNGRVDKARLVDDLGSFMDRYSSASSMSDLDIASIFTDLTEVTEKHGITMPGEYTMLVRGLVTIGGVAEELCPSFDVFSFVTNKMLERARRDFDLKSALASEAREFVNMGTRTFKLPALTYDALRNLAKGRTKLNLELTGYDDLLERLLVALQSAFMAAFACVVFIGGCILCITDIEPEIHDMPLAAYLCFVLAFSLGIYAVRRMRS